MTEEQKQLIGRTFRHFKGKLYRLEGFAKDSETLEEMVVYVRCMENMACGCVPPRCSSRPSRATERR